MLKKSNLMKLKIRKINLQLFVQMNYRKKLVENQILKISRNIGCTKYINFNSIEIEYLFCEMIWRA